jgi:tRNA nucleotidyltransferase (CCA-adding enzyme)
VLLNNNQSLSSLRAYLVGGAIRNQLLGLPAKDKDWVVVGSTPKEMLALGFLPVGRGFPVFLHPITHEEYALARLERKVGQGYRGFECISDPSVTLEEDLSRRDLTINAMAMGPDGVLIDPYGGLVDLNNRVLRHVSPAFLEDPLRVLRVARFAAQLSAFHFTVHPETLALMRQCVATGELKMLSAERIWTELHKALQSQAPSLFIQVLRESQALVELLPEIDAAFSSREKTPEGKEWLIRFWQVMNSIKSESGSILSFAVLFCIMERYDDSLVRDISLRLRAPKEYMRLASLVGRYGPSVQGIPSQTPEQILDFIMRVDALRKTDIFLLFLEACAIQAEVEQYGQPSVSQSFISDIYSVESARIFLTQLIPALKALKVQSDGLSPVEIAHNVRQSRLDLICQFQKSALSSKSELS